MSPGIVRAGRRVARTARLLILANVPRRNALLSLRPVSFRLSICSPASSSFLLLPPRSGLFHRFRTYPPGRVVARLLQNQSLSTEKPREPRRACADLAARIPRQNWPQGPRRASDKFWSHSPASLIFDINASDFFGHYYRRNEQEYVSCTTAFGKKVVVHLSIYNGGIQLFLDSNLYLWFGSHHQKESHIARKGVPSVL